MDTIGDHLNKGIWETWQNHMVMDQYQGRRSVSDSVQTCLGFTINIKNNQNLKIIK